MQAFKTIALAVILGLGAQAFARQSSYYVIPQGAAAADRVVIRVHNRTGRVEFQLPDGSWAPAEMAANRRGAQPGIEMPPMQGQYGQGYGNNGYDNGYGQPGNPGGYGPNFYSGQGYQPMSPYNSYGDQDYRVFEYGNRGGNMMPPGGPSPYGQDPYGGAGFGQGGPGMGGPGNPGMAPMGPQGPMDHQPGMGGGPDFGGGPGYGGMGGAPGQMPPNMNSPVGYGGYN